MRITKHTSETPEILTVEAVEALTALKKETIYAKCRAGIIPHIRLNARCIRFRRSAIESWLDSKAR